MTFPGSINLLTNVIQDSAGNQPAELYTIANPYTYALGTNATGSLPAGWQIVPKGSFPCPVPTAPSAGTAVTTLGHYLTPSSTYLYALTNVTRNGETQAGATRSYTTGGTAAGSTGVSLPLPAVTVATYNPVLERRLYRTKAGGATLYYIGTVEDLAVLTYVDGAPDENLVQTAPGSDTSGITSPIASIAITGYGGNATEKAPGSSLVGNDFTVDYTLGVNGGVVTFSSVDATKQATITYSGAHLVNAAYLNALVLALKDLSAQLGGVGHILSTGSVPVLSNWAVGLTSTGFTSGSTAATDTRGSLQFTTGAGGVTAGSPLVTVSFAVAYPHFPIVLLSNGGTQVAFSLLAVATSSLWIIQASSALPALTSYIVNYIVIG